MRDLSSTELLDAWERGLGAPGLERTLALLGAADPDSSADEHAALPLGERNTRLLALRRWAFGSTFEGVAQCSSCGADLELAFDLEELNAGAPPPKGGDSTLRADGYEVRFRLPDSADERAAARAANADAARRILLERCVTSSICNDGPVDPAELPDDVVARIEDAMEERDPHADLRLAVECAECGHAFEAPLDAGGFVWAEVDQWARRTLVDVATLASAFGWPEDEVLALTPLRRQAYLEIVGR